METKVNNRKGKAVTGTGKVIDVEIGLKSSRS